MQGFDGADEPVRKWGALHDLKQVKTFLGDPAKFPKVLHDGTELIGTDEAIKEEMMALWARLRAGYGEELRANMRKVKDICYKSRQEGRSRQEMEGFAQYF